jgi:hypothetical protein
VESGVVLTFNLVLPPSFEDSETEHGVDGEVKELAEMLYKGDKKV